MAVMLAAYFPYLTFAVPGIAGIAIMLTFIEAGAPYALGAYAVSGILSLILCEKESAVLFVLLFGLYPILKVYIEKVKGRILEWIIKMVYFNFSAALSFMVATFVFGIEADEFTLLGKWAVYILFAAYNVTFVLYDFCLSQVAANYFKKYRRFVTKIFKK